MLTDLQLFPKHLSRHFFFFDVAVSQIRFWNLATSNVDVLLHLVTHSIFSPIFKDNHCTITSPCSLPLQWCSDTSRSEVMSTMAQSPRLYFG